jgi:deoxyribonuclease-4
MTITLICESPLLEKDALLMKEILERNGVHLAD